MKNPQKLILIFLCLFLFSCGEEEPADKLTNITPPGQNNPQDPDPTPDPDPDPTPTTNSYTPLGVGGGGAMSGFAINPYNSTRYVGTDMGTLFRSDDNGETWNAINHYQVQYDSHLAYSTAPGFSSDGQTVFYADAGRNPQISYDNGITFQDMNLNLPSGVRILYWKEDSSNENIIFAGTTEGLYRTTNKGQSWIKTNMTNEKSLGTFLDHYNGVTTLYHATSDKIMVSTNLGDTRSTLISPNHEIRLFTGGRTGNDITLAYSDDDGQGACAWASAYASGWGQAAVTATMDNCGYVWIKKNQSNFIQSNQAVGNFLRMAENDAYTIYVTAGKEWIRQRGTQVHVSNDRGDNWSLKLYQMNWDDNYSPWLENLIEYSAVALDIGWWDDGYESFAINNLDSSKAGGTGYFFLHTTENTGDNWLAPFTNFADTGFPAPKKKWKTGGIEVISVYHLKHHPINNNVVYAACGNIGGMVSDDAGETFRVSKAKYNSNYDYAFDRNDDQVVFAASGSEHDFPETWHANATVAQGGIYYSSDRGINWSRLTPTNNGFNRQFLSVAYDDQRGRVYGGTHGGGIAYSANNGSTWQWLNNGFPGGNRIISQLEIDPENGNVYAMLAGDAPNYTNRAQTGIYFLDVENGSTSWQLLRGNVAYPSAADPGYQVWWYPIAFAVDFNDPQRNTLWLVDYENNENWLMTGAWKSTDRGQNWERKIQFTMPTSIKLDPKNSDHVYVGGTHYLDGSWGNGGHIFSTDGGETWNRNLTPGLQANARNLMFDPTNSENIYYTYLGGGILKGPNPARQPASVEIEPVTD